MNPSLFLQFVTKYFPSLTTAVYEYINSETVLLTYLHLQMLRKEYSADGKYQSLTVNNQLVMADVIAMDSSIPLKTRPTIAQASGDIPKMGLEFALTEKQIDDIRVMIARNMPEAQIVSKIFSDVRMAIGGVYERNEAIFLEGLSSGVTVVDNTETVGTGIRIDYGYKAANQFESSVSWDDVTNASFKPFTDIQQVIDQATTDGNNITTVMLDRTTFNRMVQSAEAKAIYAAASSIHAASVPVPTLSQINTATQDRFGFNFKIVDRRVRFQRNGTNTTVTPWKSGSVVFLTTEQVGTLAWARLAEMDGPVPGVMYQTVDDYILVSKFHTNRPHYAEFTNSQARVVPVIGNVDAVYTLDTTQDNP